MRNYLFLGIFLVLAFGVAFSLGSVTGFSQSCTTEADCTNAGVPYCECNGAQADYCLDGQSWKVVDYRCDGGSCIAGKSSSSSSSYICDNGQSVWNNVNELESWCQDGKDNDYDGAIDCADSDCSSVTACIPTTTTTTYVTVTTIPQCDIGSAVSDLCYCKGIGRYDGYCCEDGTSYGAWSSGSCTTTTTVPPTTTTTAYATTTTYATTTYTTSGYCGDYICNPVEYQYGTSSCVVDCGTDCNFDGLKESWDCTTSTSYSTTTYDNNGSGYCGNSICDAGETSSSCPADCGGYTNYDCDSGLKAILGDGCHYMYNDASGNRIYCNGEMSISARKGDATYMKGCSSGTTYLTYGTTYTKPTYRTTTTYVPPTYSTTTYSNVCSRSATWNCYDKSSCSGAGSNWCVSPGSSYGYCSEYSCPTYTCSSSEPWNCYDKSSCSGSGSNWCESAPAPIYNDPAAYSLPTTSGYCQQYECPDYSCKSDQPWNCYEESSCSGAGANWCDSGNGYGWCSDYECPTCSADSPWNCYEESSCSGAGANWCGGDKSGWCSDYECPSCDSKTAWNCYDKSSCSGAGANWCVTGSGDDYGYCSDYTCPVCSPSQPWNCYDQSSCSGSSGKWCKNDYSAVSGSPLYPNGGSGYCMDEFGYCPSDTTTVTSPGGNITPPSTTIPPGCVLEYDYDTDADRIVCYRHGGEFSCDGAPDDWDDSCEFNGGRPIRSLDGEGCEVFTCEFLDGDFDRGNIFGDHGECPTEDEIIEVIDKCEAFDGEGVIEKIGGCLVPVCRGFGDDEICEEESDPVLKKSREKECSLGGFDHVTDFDSVGCPITVCLSDVASCPKNVPDSAFTRCEKEGGEMIVRKNVDGCIKFSECVSPGNEDDVVIGRNEVNEVPPVEVLLNVVLKLEELDITFDRLARKTEAVALYYNEIGSTKADKFRRISNMFDNGKDKTEDIRDMIRLAVESDSITLEQIIDIKHEIRYMNKVLIKDILFVMLSKTVEKDLTEAKDCGSDGVCFEKAFKLCRLAKFRPEGELGPVVELRGLDGNTCVMYAEQTTPLGNFDMTCKIKNYALGIRDADNDIFPYCEGSLADLVSRGEREIGKKCAQVITSATGSDGSCVNYPTPCDVPEGWNVVGSCKQLTTTTTLASAIVTTNTTSV